MTDNKRHGQALAEAMIEAAKDCPERNEVNIRLVEEALIKAVSAKPSEVSNDLIAMFGHALGVLESHKSRTIDRYLDSLQAVSV
jgi:hypothetical protein